MCVGGGGGSLQVFKYSIMCFNIYTHYIAVFAGYRNHCETRVCSVRLLVLIGNCSCFDLCSNCCVGDSKSDVGQEAVMLVVSEPPDLEITLSPVDTWKISCCPCSPINQCSGSVVVSGELPKKLARRSIALQASVRLVLYGGVLQQGGRSVGPAVFFHSPLALESDAFRLRVPMYGAMSSTCGSCSVSPFKGDYDRDSLLYMFKPGQPNGPMYSQRDPSHMVIAVKDTAILRPSCFSKQADLSPCCLAFKYEVRLYQLTSTELRREICVVVFIKSKLWEEVGGTSM